MVRVRFAPSPTGYLHIGSARTALFNWLFARHNRGKFILRIEDTDQARSKGEYLETALKELRWLGLDWDEGPFFQMQRLRLYKEYADKLLNEGKAYWCYCTPEELKSEREKPKEATPPTAGRSFIYSGRCRDLSESQKNKFEKDGRLKTVRFKAPGGVTKIMDLIKGDVLFDNSLFDDFIILKSDGIPVYNFAAVIDDYTMDITHIIRGEEHLSNTPRQIMLYNALGFKIPAFAHIPIILNKKKEKLSKREGGSELKDFIHEGFLPQAVFNFLALLGWSPKEDIEILSREKLIEEFSLEGISKSPSVFDPDKLLWMNSQYIKKLSNEELCRKSLHFFISAGLISEGIHEKERKYLEKVSGLFRERIKKLCELPEKAGYFFKDDFEFNPSSYQKFLHDEENRKLLGELALKLDKLEEFTLENIEKVIRAMAEEKNIKAAKLIHPARVAVCGKEESPSLFEMMEILGKEKTIKRLKNIPLF